MSHTLPLEPASLSVAINGAQLRSLRKGRRMTQTKLAHEAKIAAPLISFIETGARSRVREETFEQICGALALDCDERTALGSRPTD
jgi:transcriptional regulator with XRE-family HTH domain